MMFTFGDVRDVLSGSSAFVEELVRSQLLDLLKRAAGVTVKRSSRSVSVEDILWLVRHDPLKKRRLSEFLRWRDVRKNIRDAEEETIDADVEDELPDSEGRTLAKGNTEPSLAAADVQAFESTDASDADSIDDRAYRQETRQRLLEADRITRGMTRSAYVDYSECRQASFVFKKAKRFRDWLSLGDGVAADGSVVRVSEDAIEVLGYIAWEIVRRITVAGCAIRKKSESQQTVAESSAQPQSLEDLLLLGHDFDWAQFGASASSAVAPNAQLNTPLSVKELREALRRFEFEEKRRVASFSRSGGGLRIFC